MAAPLTPPRALGAALALASLLAPAASHAFCRTWSCDPAEEKKATQKDCPPDPQNKSCPGGDPARHKPLFWPQKCIGFSISESVSKKIVAPSDADRRKRMARITDTAFATWQKADCGGGKRPSLSFTDLGFIECDQHEFNGYDGNDKEKVVMAQGNANVIAFREKWPAKYSDTGNALALTTLTFRVSTGEIYDADIEINGEQDLSTSDTDVKFDLQSILTHEIGHFIGLAHSPVADATMFTPYAGGHLDLRSLSPDDVAAVCAVYPPDRTGLPECDPTPRHGYSGKCGGPNDPPGCSASAGRATALPAGLGLGLVAGAAALRALRRRQGRSRA